MPADAERTCCQNDDDRSGGAVFADLTPVRCVATECVEGRDATQLGWVGLSGVVLTLGRLEGP